MTRITPKYVQIANDLREKISNGVFKPGDPLPTHRELMDQHGVALMTIRQVLEQLRSEGLIWSRRGKGTFVAQPEGLVAAQEGASCIGLFIVRLVGGESNPRWEDYGTLTTLQEELAGRDIDFFVRYVRPGQVDEVVKWAEGLAAVVLWGILSWELIERIVETGKVVVVAGCLDGDRCPPGAGWIYTPLRGVVDLGISYLAGLGHRAVTLVNRQGSPYWTGIGHHFRRATAELGLVEADELILGHEEDEAEIVPYLERKVPRPTALLVEGGIRAARLIRHLERSGRQVPQDVSVLAISTATLMHMLGGNLSFIDTEGGVSTMLQRAGEMALEMLQQHTVLREAQPYSLSLGSTCRPVQSAPVPGT